MREWLVVATEYAVLAIDALALVIIVYGTAEAFIGGCSHAAGPRETRGLAALCATLASNCCARAVPDSATIHATTTTPPRAILKNWLARNQRSCPVFRLADQDVDNYHGISSTTSGPSDATALPYIFGGLGATPYSPGDYDPAIPNFATLTPIDSETRFSTTWGGGVKFYPTQHLGVKAGLRWTPTYIKSDAEGLWCDPFFATCWVVGDADYSNQLEISAGITFRFGGE